MYSFLVEKNILRKKQILYFMGKIMYIKDHTHTHIIYIMWWGGP